MPSSRSKSKQELWEDQYIKGETKGPWWYQKLTLLTKDREQVTLDLLKLHDLSDATIIDLGCGEGNLVRWLSPLANKVIGTDIARNRLKLAEKKSKKHKNISYQETDLDKKLPFKSNYADVITCIGVLEYTLDPYHSISEIVRVLKPGGTFILEVPNLAFLPERAKLLFGKLPSWPDATGWQGGRLHNFTFGSTVKLLEENGLKVVKQTGAGFLKPLRDWYPSLLCGDVVIEATHV